MVMPYHVLFDQYEEERLKGKSFGSTKSGIAPFYSDKYAKIGIPYASCFIPKDFVPVSNRCLKLKIFCSSIFIISLPLMRMRFSETLMSYKDQIAPYVCNTFEFLQKAQDEGKNILLEGQLGSLKDPVRYLSLHHFFPHRCRLRRNQCGITPYNIKGNRHRRKRHIQVPSALDPL